MFKRIAVLMGGWGEEREISLKTGKAVMSAFETLGHEAVRIVAGPDLDKQLRSARADVAFLALHGRMGEDGRAQGLCEVLGIPYTGSGVLASALAMNKDYAKKLFRFHNLPTPCGYVVRGPLSVEAVLTRHGDMGFPCIVKPSSGGSSIGVSLVSDDHELFEAVQSATHWGGEALVERCVRGTEVTVAILGDSVLGSLEIAPKGDVFDYANKYQGRAEHHLPPRLSKPRVEALEGLALAAYRALGCRGYGRVDLIASDADNDAVLEVNTLPGLTPMSLFPKIAKFRGLSFPELVEEIVKRAALDGAAEPIRQRSLKRASAAVLAF